MDMRRVAGQEHPPGAEAIDHATADAKLGQPGWVADLAGSIADPLGHVPTDQIERALGRVCAALLAALDEQPPAPLAGHWDGREHTILMQPDLDIPAVGRPIDLDIGHIKGEWV